MIDQQPLIPAWRRHPVVVAGAAGVMYWAIVNGWYVTVAVCALAVILLATRRHLRVVARRRAALRARADYEHRLSLAGDPRGLYGRYPPVQAGWFPDPGRVSRWRYFDGTFWTGHTSPR